MRFPDIAEHALTVFGSHAKALAWLTARCGALDGRVPFELLMRGDLETVDTELGIEAIGSHLAACTFSMRTARA